MEQAGILNCVSVPDGAPQQVSTKGLLSKKQVYIDPGLFVCYYAIMKCISPKKSLFLLWERFSLQLLGRGAVIF